jgi:hypothetical protein
MFDVIRNHVSRELQDRLQGLPIGFPRFREEVFNIE